MKAIIMAGGEGSRLRPLTCDCPKPMLRLMGRPLMEHAIGLLQKYGVTEIGATLGYLPDAVMDYFGDGEGFGVSLHYYVEDAPLGTAGSVRQAKDFLDERFLVLSGDGVTDFDLSEAVRFHESRSALATLVLVRSGAPQEYGMVVTDPDGRVRSFHEKPGRSEIYSDRINTGIYILEPEVLERIPEGTPCDFGHDLFPAMVREGLPVYGCTLSGYWCDVGDVGAYLRAHADAMDGRIHLDGLAPRARTSPRARASARTAPSARAALSPRARTSSAACCSAARGWNRARSCAAACWARVRWWARARSSTRRAPWAAARRSARARCSHRGSNSGRASRCPRASTRRRTSSGARAGSSASPRARCCWNPRPRPPGRPRAARRN